MAYLVEPPSDGAPNLDAASEPAMTRKAELCAWVMEKVDRWKDQRDTAWQALWSEYYRLWRGRWISEDKTRNSERSRIVTPALAQALEMTVAELEEALFGREQWIDVLDDNGNPDHEDTNGYRKRLLGDMARDRVPSAVTQSLLTGALYGAMAAKVVVEETTDYRLEKIEDENGQPQNKVVPYPRVKVCIVPIPVTELVPDPEGETVEDMLGIAHDCRRPKTTLLRFPWGKEYALTPAESMEADWREYGKDDPEDKVGVDDHSVRLTEWHGLVPARLLAEPKDDDVLGKLLVEEADPSEDMDSLVEAIVIIADGCKVLQAIANPFIMKDRSIVAAPFEKVPGRFWGRGVMEKGYNPQKALDGEVRMRMDVMAIIGNPMIGIDATALPRGFDMRVRPGKAWMTNGPPKYAIHPIVFPGLDPASFNQTSEMERMVQMGTGAMDTATPLRENRRYETASGASMIAGTFVKRAKRALRTINQDFIEPLIQKVVWRKLQYDPQRYTGAFDFRVVSTLGIVAREMEQGQLTQMIGLLPPGSPAQLVAVKAIFDSTSSPYKAEMMAAVTSMLTPDPEQQQMQQMVQQLQMAQLQGEVQKLGSETMKNLADVELKKGQTIKAIAEAQAAAAQPGVDQAALQLEVGKLMLGLRELEQYARQIDVSAITAQANLIKAKKQGEKSSD